MADQYINNKKFYIEDDGTLSVTTADYEDLVTSDDDIPNKKYVDEKARGVDGGIAASVYLAIQVVDGGNA